MASAVELVSIVSQVGYVKQSLEWKDKTLHEQAEFFHPCYDTFKDFAQFVLQVHQQLDLGKFAVSDLGPLFPFRTVLP
jgi:hypothetical protein